MFGNIDQVKQIVKGHFNEISNKEQELYNYRIRICRECPLYSDTSFGPMCDAKKCIDKNGNLFSFKKNNCISGCGCRLNAKTRVKDAKCVLNKW